MCGQVTEVAMGRELPTDPAIIVLGIQLLTDGDGAMHLQVHRRAGNKNHHGFNSASDTSSV